MGLASVGVAEPVRDRKPPDLAEVLAALPGFWTLDRKEAFLALQADGSRWDAQAGVLKMPQALRFGSLEIPRSDLWFDGDRRAIRWEGVLFDRKGSTKSAEADLAERFAAATNALTAWAGTAPMAMVRPDHRSAWVWGRSPHIVSVEWSPRSTAGPSSKTAWLRVVAEPWPPRRDWSTLVRRTVDGDRFLAVPMVDQQVQGFCAPATVERLMRHYGIPLDAAALGQLAESSTDAGTNVQRMLGKLAQLRELRCEVRELFGFDVKRFDRLIVAYNAMAERQGLATLAYTPPVLDLGQVFLAADPATLRAAAAGQGDRKRFWREVRESVDAGHPLMWGVVLGIVPEPGIPPQTRGGHLRLVVGYNEARQEILYSDSWGRGHECKRLALADAWAMTMTLHALRPVP